MEEVRVNKISFLDLFMLCFLLFVVGFGSGMFTVVFQITELGVCDNCTCDAQRYIDLGCEYDSDEGWTCYDRGSIERIRRGLI